MSNTDSFIDEVADEVRRDKLYGYLRRYGWIGVLVVLLIVGGAAWTEYRAAQDRRAAETTGDALLDAMEVTDDSARATAIAAVEADGPTTVVTGLLTAAMQVEAGDTDAAAATLNSLAANGDVPQMYRELAAFKAAILPSDDKKARIDALTDLSAPGQPFRLLALEQLAHATLSDGNVADTVATLRQIEDDAAVSRSLRERVQTLLVALGEEPNTAAAPLVE